MVFHLDVEIVDFLKEHTIDSKLLVFGIWIIYMN